MKKLKYKAFLVIYVILTIFSLTLLSIYNIQEYNTHYNRIENILNFNNILRPPKVNNESPNVSNMRFMDVNVYSIILNDNNTIKNIISHTKDGNISDNISKEVNKIIDTNNKMYIGNLYKDRYSYKYVSNHHIILVDNKANNEKLTHVLKNSLIGFIITQIISYIIAIKLSLWMSKPVEEAFQKQKDFIADASHELKTPLAVIMASADALVDNKDEKWINNIQNESERMNRLITNLLDLSKIENNTQFEIINLSKLIEKSVLTIESLLYENNIKLKYNIDNDISFKCNSDEIKQLITILIDNAIKHSSKNGKIIVNLLQERNNIKLEVINKGEAIKKEEEEKIFERFYRADKSRNRDDNRYGLGLAIASSIVKKHNGTIKAHSENGYTTFRVNFKKK